MPSESPEAPDTPDTPEAPDTPDVAPQGASPRRRRTAATNRWMRWLHVYTSMISLLVVLFFAVTGLTLNHPSWTFGDDTDRTTVTGTLPDGWQRADGSPEFLAISEYFRSTYDVGGEVADFGVDNGQAVISYKGPGYAADAFVDTTDGSFELVVEAQGWVGVINDLHKGRDTSTLWSWVIDVSAVFLALVALTGLGIQLFQRKRRTQAIVVAVVFAVVAVVLALTTLA